MGIISSNKQVNVTQLSCDGTAHPADIVLVLDRSGSMAGAPLASMKAGADAFIDIIAEASGGTGGNIGSGSRIAIVSFSDTATADTQLITSVANLKQAVNSLVAGGSTNHAEAFFRASQLLSGVTTSQKVIVMFTDGKTTSGSPPAPVAEAAKQAGAVIYCIGLVGSDGIDVSALNEWASDPDVTHVAVTPNFADLEELFKELAENISKPGATSIVIDEVVNSDFRITSIAAPNKGTVVQTGQQSLQWKIDQLGVSKSESAILEFDIQHISKTGGLKQVNASITYSDKEGNKVVFPDPSLMVDCDIIVHPEPCPKPVELEVEGCRDTAVVDLGEVELESLGGIVELSLTVKDVCPGRRVAVAVILTEVDENGEEYSRGMKAFTLPTHDGPACRDVRVECIHFVLPEDLDVSQQTPNSLCGARRLKARVLANQIDTDYRCCGELTVLR